jgi:hypothetical protein
MDHDPLFYEGLGDPYPTDLIDDAARLYECKVTIARASAEIDRASRNVQTLLEERPELCEAAQNDPRAAAAAECGRRLTERMKQLRLKDDADWGYEAVSASMAEIGGLYSADAIGSALRGERVPHDSKLKLWCEFFDRQLGVALEPSYFSGRS